MNFEGLLIGAFSFIIIGLFHPLVIKGEYYFSVKIWKAFFIAGLVFLFVSLFITGVLSIFAGIISFSSFWSVKEVFEQQERVLKGWQKMNPDRKDYYKNLRKDYVFVHFKE